MHTFAFSDSSQGHLGGGKQPGQVEQGAVVFISLSLDVVAWLYAQQESWWTVSTNICAKSGFTGAETIQM